MKILIIDDDEIDRMIVIRTFKQAHIDLDITQASDGREGLAVAHDQDFDIILLDYRLPDMDGIEILKELQHSNQSDATVVMLSGEENEELARLAIEQGAQDFFLKSEINANRLMRTMQQAKQRHLLEQQLKQNHQELKRLAESDTLTGLSNRYYFERALNLAVERMGRGGKLALLLLDIDKFKMVNDTFGHEVGDDLLKAVAKKLKETARASDLVARLGGDEFVVLMQDYEKDEQANLLANRILDKFEEPVALGSTAWNVTTSIGIAVLGDSKLSPNELLKCADIAMYRAKQEGRNRTQFYSHQLHEKVRKRALLEQDIRRAIKNDELCVFYQAQVDTLDHSLAGIEALIRWQHPKLGMLGPDQFLPIAEELGLMNDIGRWVLAASCEQMKQWKSAFPGIKAKLAVAVNLSAIQLYGSKLVGQVDQVLAQTNLDASCLELEITENALIKDPASVAILLNNLSEKGVSIALDDFGTGYSSFEHLKLFPINRFKIDKSFVKDIHNSHKADLLLAAMANFGSTLGLAVIAEGIETQEQADYCEMLGCTLLQGFLFSIPCKAEEFEKQFLTHLK